MPIQSQRPASFAGSFEIDLSRRGKMALRAAVFEALEGTKPPDLAPFLTRTVFADAATILNAQTGLSAPGVGPALHEGGPFAILRVAAAFGVTGRTHWRRTVYAIEDLQRAVKSKNRDKAKRARLARACLAGAGIPLARFSWPRGARAQRAAYLFGALVMAGRS